MNPTNRNKISDIYKIIDELCIDIIALKLEAAKNSASGEDNEDEGNETETEEEEEEEEEDTDVVVCKIKYTGDETVVEIKKSQVSENKFVAAEGKTIASVELVENDFFSAASLNGESNAVDFTPK